MDSKDRERLMLSTGIALVGYAIIFLLLMGLKWPPVAPFRAISPPASVYVSLQGPAPTPAATAQPVPQVPPLSSKSTVTARTPSEPQTASTQSTVSVAPTKPAATPGSSSASSSASSSSAGRQPATPAPVASQATAIPGRPNIPQSMTSSAGPSTGGAPQSGGPAAGPPSATPGVNYPIGSEPSAAPPQGSGGSGTQPNQGLSQTYYGSTGTSSGSIFNPDLAANAGSTPASTGAPGGSSSGAQAQGGTGGAPSAAGSGTAGSGGTGGTGTGSSAPSSNGPKIDWQTPSSARKVAYEPPPLVIPREYLNEIPPSIALKISFQVTPLGSVEALNVTPSTGYPGLDNLLEKWMQKWTFEPVGGNQVAQGTLPYVIQATTAR